jgi:hypothetical protein
MALPGRGRVEFASGSLLPDVAAAYLESEGRLKKLLSKGIVLEAGAPELPQTRHVLPAEPDVTEKGISVEEAVYTPPNASSPPKPVTARDYGDPGSHPYEDISMVGSIEGFKLSAFKMDPVGLNQLSVDQLRMVCLDKGLAEDMPDSREDMIRSLSRDWSPSSADQAEKAKQLGFYSK